MRRYIVLAIILGAVHILGARSIQVRQADVTQAALPVYVGWNGEQTDVDKRIYERFMACLSYSGQFAPCGDFIDRIPHMKDALRARFQEGYMLAIYVTCSSSQLKWRVYDVAEGRMLAGRSFPAHTNERVWAYSAAQDLWKYLTDQPAPFMSHLTYVRSTRFNNIPQYHLCIADFDGTHEQVVYTSSAYLMSPQWGWIDRQPVIFFSEFTARNVRVCVTDMAGNVRPIIDFDGTCVGFVQRNNEIIYCRSGMIFSCRFDARRNKRVHTPLVREYGPCASPSVDESGNIYYCYQGMIKYCDRKHDTARALLYQGYYVAPTYHIPTQMLAYAQRVNGTMQLCTYACATKTVQQITHDAGDKHDPRWSPCGRYLVYTNARDGCIYTYNIYTHERHRITSSQAACMYPTWSPAKVYIV